MADDKKRDDFTVDMGDSNEKNFERPPSPLRHSTGPVIPTVNNPIFPLLSYCFSSIMMTVTNKFVLSGLGFNLNFFLLAVQVCSRALSWPLVTDRVSSPLCVFSRFKYASHRDL